MKKIFFKISALLLIVLSLLSGCKKSHPNDPAAEINNYTITFDKNDADATVTMTDQTIASGSSANLTANAFTKTGWAFTGWATTSGGAVVYTDSASYPMGSANVTLFAKWAGWKIVGTAGFSSGSSESISLAFFNSTPYVAYRDGTNGYKATVMKFNGSNWETIGIAGFSAGVAGYPVIRIDNGIPYVTYMDVANSNKATLMKFNGTNWETVGSAGFSSGIAYKPSLAIANGILYVAYSDNTNGGKACVMKFE